MEEAKKKSSSAFLYFLGGVAAGAAAGVLLAPKSGKETREDLNEWTKKSREQAQALLKKVRGSKPSYEGVKNGARELIGETREKAGEFVAS
jgi:gas vesicle protein